MFEDHEISLIFAVKSISLLSVAETEMVGRATAHILDLVRGADVGALGCSGSLWIIVSAYC